MKVQTKESLAAMTPKKALAMLQKGNQRFVESRREQRNLMEQMTQTSEGQYPFAVVLGCVDSRVPPELIFDLGIGDVFSIRIAGNFVNEDILGSMEFACKVIGSKHILVLGHTSCGAIQGAYDDVKLGNLTGLVNKLKPAIEAVGRSSSDIDKFAEMNVRMTIEQIKKHSPILKEMLDNDEIGISGAMYDLETGKVSFL
ncbi:MAG: hypothetical protein JXA13_12955 [Anaerolineales bacterium]|nr:hypothetical protein [Anaerolineales bacterium]